MASKKKKSLLTKKYVQKYIQQNPVYRNDTTGGKYKITAINPFTKSAETDLGKYGKLYTGNRRTDLQTGGGTNTLTRSIESAAESRKRDREMKRRSEAFQRKLDATKGRGYKGPLADVADKYLGPIANPIGDAIEKGYYKAVQGAKKIKRKITKKAKTALKKYKQKKPQKKSVRKFGSMITSKNVNPFTGAKQIKTLSGSFKTINPKTSGERASKSERYTDKYRLNKTSDTEIEIARKKKLARKKKKK